MKISNIALLPYFGNKDRELDNINNNLPNMNDIDIINEPYCGSFAVIRFLLSVYRDK